MNNKSKSKEELLMELIELRKEHEYLKDVYNKEINELKQTQNILFQTKQTYQDIFNTLDEAIYILDESGTFIDVNEGAARLYKCTRSELIGLNPSKVAAAGRNNLDEISKMNSDTFRTGISSQFEFWAMRKSGEIFPKDVRTYKGRYFDRDVLIATARDISQRKNTEITLMENEKILNHFFTQSTTGFFFMMIDKPIVWNDSIDKEKILDYVFANQRITKVNQALLDQYGAQEKDFVGLTPMDFHSKDLESGRRAWSKLFDNGIRHYETKEYKFDGTPIYFFGDYVCLYDSEGKITGHFGIQIDITDRKLAEEALKVSEERYRILFDTMPTGFYQSTPDGYFLDANPAMLKMLGYDSLEELKTVHIPTTIYISESERDEILTENSEFTNQLETYRLKSKNGDIIWLEDNARYVKDTDGNILYHEGLCKDITGRKQAEEVLRHSENKLKELNATKDRFFSIIAHDLKNPIGSYREIISMLYDKYSSFSDEERLEFLGAVKESSKQMYELLDNLLEWSRSQRGLIQFNPVETNLYMLAENCESFLQLSALKKNIELLNKIPTDTISIVDPNLINIILRNLVSNAIKFSKEGGKIIVGLNEAYNDKGLCVYIKDSGLGMSPVNINKLFQIDKNVSTRGTAGEKGTGLGLILCKEFVEKHGGKIWVESEEGVGSTFSFTLPLIS